MIRVLSGFLYLLGTLLTLWAAAALWFDFPIAALGRALAVLYPLGIAGMLKAGRADRNTRVAWIVSLLIIVGWWFTLKPTNNRDWQRDVDRVAWADISSNAAVIHNIRNFDYVSEKSFTPRWDDRTVDISQIRGVDIFLSHWGSPWIAHAIASFSFADGTHLAASIEARKAEGQDYSAIRGFFRQYEILYLIAEERDVIAVRTNYRGEEVYLYHTLTTPADAQNLFRQYLQWMNHARLQPEWYNALTRNCVSDFVSYLARVKVGGISPWDWKVLLDGRADEMLYNLGDLAGNLPFSELKVRALINPAARRAGQSPDFSRIIRAGRPGFEPDAASSKNTAHLEIPFAMARVPQAAAYEHGTEQRLHQHSGIHIHRQP